jgi:hypothetical protein
MRAASLGFTRVGGFIACFLFAVHYTPHFRFRRSLPVENSPYDLHDEGLPALSRTFQQPSAEPPLIPDEHGDERQDGKD